jgi:hypothetical protein
MQNTDATLAGLTRGAIQREADGQDRLTQWWSSSGGAGGRRHRGDGIGASLQGAEEPDRRHSEWANGGIGMSQR